MALKKKQRLNQKLICTASIRLCTPEFYFMLQLKKKIIIMCFFCRHHQGLIIQKTFDPMI